MSTDTLCRVIADELDRIRALQVSGLPPVTCAFAVVEGDPLVRGPRPGAPAAPTSNAKAAKAVTTNALRDPCHQFLHPTPPAWHPGPRGGGYATCFSFSDGQLLPGTGRQSSAGRANRRVAHRGMREEAIREARDVCERLVAVVDKLPAPLADRLGFGTDRSPTDWVAVLVHLGWHFPTFGIGGGRYRILAGAGGGRANRPYPELKLQLDGVPGARDACPGVIVSRLDPTSKFLKASANALDLFSKGLDVVEKAARPQSCGDFARLHAEFLELAVAQPQSVVVRVLRLTDSFRTPPATAWARRRRGGVGPCKSHDHVLSHWKADRVVCELRGPGVETFRALANRAGNLLPRWPADQYPAVLSDVGAFARRGDPSKYPSAVKQGDLWNRGMVTDHRGTWSGGWASCSGSWRRIDPSTSTSSRDRRTWRV